MICLLHTGRDCMGCAKTGSGKTAAFVLPVLQKLSEDPYGIFCLVLTPTRSVQSGLDVMIYTRIFFFLWCIIGHLTPFVFVDIIVKCV